MKKLILFLIPVLGFSQFQPSTISCQGSNWRGYHWQLCVDQVTAGNPVNICNNPAACFRSSDWSVVGSSGGTGIFSMLTVTGSAYFGSVGTPGSITFGDASTGTTILSSPSTANGTLLIGGVPVPTASGVTSVFTRSGAVIANSGDYSVGQVTGAAPIASPTFTGAVNGLIHSVTFNISGNGSTIITGATNQYIESEFISTIGIYKVITTGTGATPPSNCSITVDIWKLNVAVPTSTNKISASAPASLSSAQYSSNTTNTGWTTSVAVGDVWSVNVATVTGCISATVQIWWQ